MDHKAIYKAYPDCVEIYDDKGAFRSDGTKIDLVQSDIDAARSLLDAEEAAVAYQYQRTGQDGTTSVKDTVYESLGNQLDMIYKDLIAGKFDTTGTWAKHIAAVKAKYPKPS